ncbi:plasmid partitioning protein RepB [Mesorhizobium sp. M0496]|uniref:plasmid partitioning protein RepB n=1 Tax=Mesorhizobium sp. M0496 TaxID=2956952 RepID=UPI00333AD026
MARKNLLTSVTASIAPARDSEGRAEYAKRGASRSMMQSLDEMAENSMRLLDGETVVSLDPALVTASFVSDRIEESDEEYRELREAIRTSGQASPILVRPHPEISGRYMIVFGHRRAKVARDLGINVRAVVKPMADIAHVITQGQENTARADLSFIEKALFAKKLADSGMTKDTLKAALTVDDTLLSRMLSVAETVPDAVLDAVGAAKGVGRDRWEDLKKLVRVPANAAKAVEFVASNGFGAAQSDERFNLLLNFLSVSKKPKKGGGDAKAKIWAPPDKSVTVVAKGTGKAFSLALRAKDGPRFGGWISENLEQLYQAFRDSEKTTTGD